jgi:hypothetical protein
VLKALGRRFFKTQANDNSRMSSRELFERMKSNSGQWHQASNTQLAQAVSRVNAEMDRPRVTFVKIDFPAAYSSAAPKTRLWGFNRSPFRMALLFLSFGKIYCPATMKCASKDLQAATSFMKNRETKPLNKGKIERLCSFSVAMPLWAIRIEREPCFMQMQSPKR